LYHLLTGQPPFDGETPAAVMMQHVNSPLTPPYMINPQISADICEIVEKAMAKDINRRYQEYDPLLADLKEAKMARLAKEKAASAASAPARESAPWDAGYSQISAAAAEAEPGAPPAPGGAATGYGGAQGGEGAGSPYLSQGKVISETQLEGLRKPPRSGNRLIALLVLFVCALMGLLYMSESGSDGGSSRILPAVVQNLLARLGRGESNEEKYARAYLKSVQRIEFIAAAVSEFVLANGREPKNLNEVLDRKLVTESDLVDGFGGYMRYDAVMQRIRTAGPDRILDTSDDFIADKSGKLLAHPDVPVRVQQEELTQIRERGHKPLVTSPD
jgi:hypothetical protein